MSLRNLIISLLVFSYGASGVMAQSVSLEPITGFYGNYVLPGQPVEIGVRIKNEGVVIWGYENFFGLWTHKDGLLTDAFDTAQIFILRSLWEHRADITGWDGLANGQGIDTLGCPLTVYGTVGGIRLRVSTRLELSLQPGI